MQKPLHLTRDGGNRFVEVSGGQQRNARELAPGRTQSMDPPPADRWWCVCSTHTIAPNRFATEGKRRCRLPRSGRRLAQEVDPGHHLVGFHDPEFCLSFFTELQIQVAPVFGLSQIAHLGQGEGQTDKTLRSVIPEPFKSKDRSISSASTRA